MSTQQQEPEAQPPDNDLSAEHFERSIEFEKADEQEQIVAGAILIPDELDTQLDYFRAETIRDLAENYEERFENGDVYGGVMHSVFTEDVELLESRVTDEDETVGDEHYPQGTWIQRYKVTDDALWSLVDKGILSGYSIGGTAKGRVTDPIPDDVRVPDAVADGVPDDADASELPGREITEGRILESSFVDHPAVPRATHQEHKSAGVQKGHPALTDSVVQARLYLEGRGHPPDDAKRLAEYLQSEKAADESEDGGILARAKALLGRSSGGSGGESALQHSRAPDESADSAESAEKDGRTLSESNVSSVKAAHDAMLDMLDRSDVDHGRQRFTDDPADGFDVGSYGASGAKSGETTAAESAVDADDGDNPMEKDELRTMIGEVVEEKLDDADEQDDEADKADEPSDLEEIKTMLSEMQADDEGEEKDAEESDDLAEIKGMLKQMADANGVSQQADVESPNSGEEKLWGDSSPFAAGGD